MLRANFDFLNLPVRPPVNFPMFCKLLFAAVRAIPQPAVSQNRAPVAKRLRQRSERMVQIETGIAEPGFNISKVAGRFYGSRYDPSKHHAHEGDAAQAEVAAGPGYGAVENFAVVRMR